MKFAGAVREAFEYRNGELFWVKPVKQHNNLIGKSAGAVNDKGYMVIQLQGKRYRRAQLVFAYHYGHLPKPTVDHINRNRSDDRIENLREATRGLQARNHSRMNITLRRGKKFQVRLGQKRIGYFDTRKEAISVYSKAREEIYGV